MKLLEGCYETQVALLVGRVRMNLLAYFLAQVLEWNNWIFSKEMGMNFGHWVYRKGDFTNLFTV